MMNYRAALFVLPGLLSGCVGGETDGLYDVTGTVSQAGAALEGVQVSVDGAANWTVLTDALGQFLIADVTLGEHDLELRHAYDDGSFIEETRPLAVYSDTTIDSLLLPVPAVMNEPTDVTTTGMTLSWSATDAPDFREYKLYRHTSSGLDETTGTLIHVSTSSSDVTFVDTELAGLETAYYRVYTMNEFGRLGGSNIVSATTADACAAHSYTITPVSPAPDAVDHPHTDPIRFTWSDIPPDRYTDMPGASYVSSNRDGLTEEITYNLSPGTSYHFQAGWFCNDNARETALTLLDLHFSTAPAP